MDSKKKHRVHRDLVIACILFLLAAAVGMTYVRTWGGTPHMVQHMFGPSVMWAFGRGFENPKLSEAPALEDFLYLRRDSLEPSDVPLDIPVIPDDPSTLTAEDWKQFHPHRDFSGWLNAQRFHLYLMMAVALVWRVLGVSWSALTPLYGALYGVSVVAAYGLFRLATRERQSPDWQNRPSRLREVGRILSVILALLFMLAPLHLQQLPDMRDYAKAPFFLTVIFLMGYCAVKSQTPRRYVMWAGIGGTLLGLGLGFRQDLLICVPPFLAVIMFFTATKAGVVRRMAAAGTFMACFLIVGWPILNVLFTKGNNSGHDTLIGFTRYCDDRLGVGSPLYDFGDPFLDEYTRAVVMSYNERANGKTDYLWHYTREYDAVANQYFRELGQTFPADFLTRAYASVLRVVDEMRPAPGTVPRGITNPYATTFYAGYGWLTHFLLAYGRYAAALALILIATRNLRLALCALFILCWFAGYPSLRFSLRHAFHLEFIPFWVAGFLIAQAMNVLGTKLGTKHPGNANLPIGLFGREVRNELRANIKPMLRNAAIFAAIAVAGLIIPLHAARAYQTQTVGDLLAQYQSAEKQPVEFTPTEKNGAVIFIPSSEFRVPSSSPPEDTGPPIETELLVIELNAGSATTLTVCYTAADKLHNFTRTIPIKPDTTHVYAPIYHNQNATFQGLALPKQDAERLVTISRIPDLEAFPVLLTATLPEDWQAQPLYYNFTR